jgi:hypothetical protein
VSLVRTAHYGESVSLYKGEHYSPGGAIPAIPTVEVRKK